MAQLGVRSVTVESLADFALSDFSVDRTIEASEHLDQNLHGETSENKFLLGADHAFVLVLGKFAICYLGETFHDGFADVLLAYVTIVIYENFQQHH